MRKLLLVIILFGLAVTFGYCQEKEQSLQLTISSDKQVYEVGEEMVLKAILINNSDKEIIVVWIMDKAILESDKIGIVQASFPSKPLGKIEEIYIKPSSSIEKDIFVANNLIPRAYRLSFVLHYPFNLVPSNSANQERFVDALLSNTINIEVAEKVNADNAD